jgi:hypothetical protein
MSVAKRAAAWLAAAVLAAVLAPQVVRSARDARAQTTDARLRALADDLVRQQRAQGRWPCDWQGRASQLELGGPRCSTASDAARDAWGEPVLAIYQPATPRVLGAREGVIALLSAGPDGVVSTSRRRAIEERPAGDDRVRIVTRSADLPGSSP